MRYAMVLTLSACLMTTVTACSTDGNGPEGGLLDKVPSLEVSDSAGSAIRDGGLITLNGFNPAIIYLDNTGDADLKINTVTVTSEPADAYRVVMSPVPSREAPAVVPPADYPYSFTLELGPDVDPSTQPKATVTITTNTFVTADNAADNEFVFHVEIAEGKAKLLVQPGIVDFQTVAADQSSTRTVTLVNTGVADLEIDHFYLSGHLGFEAKINGNAWRVSADTASQGIALDPPVVIGPGNSTHLDVVYYSSDPEGANGQLQLDHNGVAGSTVVQLLANVAGPCISINPVSGIDFGGKGVGVASAIDLEIKSCGDLPLEISAIELMDDGEAVFSTDPSSLGLYPLVVQPNQSVYLPVSYVPSSIAEISGGQVVLDEGMLQIRSNAFLAEFDVDLSGYGTDGTCPVANISVTEGTEVIPQTRLHLSGLTSTSSGGQVNGYEWEVFEAPGSVSNFLPSRFVANPTFEVNVAGQYIFKLKVWDSLGNESCDAATVTVIVTSDEAIHVELLWDTPGDSNQGDEGVTFDGKSVGSDVDLHFIHSNAGPNGWFSPFWDCYWSSKGPNWAGSSLDDNPRLDRDDVDGAGPENLNLAIPEFGETYTVGAHYWDPWGYGNSTATIRVYIYGQLSLTWENILLVERDMWEVATIKWPSGAVERILSAPDTPRIIPNFNPPL